MCVLNQAAVDEAMPSLRVLDHLEFPYRHDATRKIRHQIVHRGLRLGHDDRGGAQKAVDTGRWLFNKIEGRPDRTKLRETGGVLRSVGRVAMTPRFPAKLGPDGITVGPFEFEAARNEPPSAREGGGVEAREALTT
jgi:hypothetical protein